jgi:signal transduction histidine kinase
VCDSGPGVEPAERPFLFEPFSQASAGRQASTPGTGLGLVICRRLVEAHDGRIWLDDTASGCRFVVSVPAARDAA